MKHVCRVILFLLVFTGSVVLFSGNMKETKSEGKVELVEQSEPTFPLMVVRTQGYDINVLHGYNSNLKASVNRESMTPVGIDRTFQLLIEEKETTIRKLKYELRKVNTDERMDYGEISVLEDTEEGKVATVTLDNSVEQGKEYAFKVTAITKEGKKIHYFTHLKYYGSDSFLKEKMDFVQSFHDKTFDPQKVSQLSTYLEISYTNEDDDYANVDITSPIETIGWGDLEPKVLSEVIPTVKEFNIETAAICMNYYVQIQSGDGPQVCKVKEFFRVRYSGGRMYLLKYDRQMDALFDIESTSVTKSQFKLGIGDRNQAQVVYSDDENRMAFVASGELWEYSLSENTAVRVFSFRNDEEDYERAAYNQHNVKIINLDQEGNMDFMVYGYMNAGDYEGCVGMIWYKYYAAEKRMEEQVFIPMETTYQMLKENIDSFTYVSTADAFYFSIENTIYSYDIVSKQLSVIAKDVAEGDYCYVKEAGLLAWQQDSDELNSNQIILMDLESKKKIDIQAPEDQSILLVGSIDTNVVYGLVKKEDLSEQADGTVFTPMYQVCIVDKTGNVLKTYEEKQIYVENAYVEENVVKLKRVKKSGTSYTSIKPDSIQSNASQKTQQASIVKRVTEKNKTEYYISLPSSFVMPKLPSVLSVKNTMMKENKIVRLDGNETDISRYYVYAEGVIIGAYNNPAKAVMEAEDSMGVVVNQNNQVVYERAGKYTNNQISSITPVLVREGVNSKGACLAMLFAYQHIAADEEALSESTRSAYHLMKEAMGDTADVVNLKGCTLDEVLYFVSGNRPVLALAGREDAFVLITEYTESTVSYISPATGKTETKSLAEAEALFEAAGNSFVGYVQ